MERLIGDFLDLNYHIIQERINSKLPKILANLRANYYHKKLIRSAKKIPNAKSYKLNKENLSEYFFFVLSNYEGKYGCIEKIIYSDTTKNLTALIRHDNWYGNIIIEKNDSKYFDFNLTYTGNSRGTQYYASHSINLSHEQIELNNLLAEINNKLLIDISNYLVDYISIFTRKEKGNYEIHK